MSLSKHKKPAYLSIKGGSIVKHIGGDKKELYDDIEAYLVSIEKVEREIKGAPVTFWQIKLKGTDGADYLLSLNYRSGVAKSLFLCLSNIGGEIGKIKIHTYERGGYTKLIVENEGQKLDWSHSVADFPPVKELAGGVKDDSQRMLFFEDLVKIIKEKIAAKDKERAIDPVDLLYSSDK